MDSIIFNADLIQAGQDVLVTIRDVGCFYGTVYEVYQSSFAIKETTILDLIDSKAKINLKQKMFTFNKADVYVGIIFD